MISNFEKKCHIRSTNNNKILQSFRQILPNQQIESQKRGTRGTYRGMVQKVSVQMSKVRNNHNWLEIAIKQNRRSIFKTKLQVNNIFEKTIKKGFSIHRNKSNEERQTKNQQSTILGSANQDIKIRKRRSPKLSIGIGFRIRNQSFERHRSCNDWLHQSRNCHF